jgi:class 3 adenylate cyclase
MMHYISKIHPSGYIERLQDLLAARMEPGVDKAAVDARIWDTFGETWAVLFTDLSGFSRAVAEFGIIHFMQVIYESQRIFAPCIDAHDGVVLKTEGDSMLVLFRHPRKAVDCAIAMQCLARDYNATKTPAEQILLCAGIGYGRVLAIGDLDVYGAEVNAASKLGEDTARAWEILVTDSVAAALGDTPPWPLEAIDTIPPGAKAAYRVAYSL